MFPIALFAAIAVNHARRANEDDARRRATSGATRIEDDRIGEIGESISRQMRREARAIERARSTEMPDLVELCDVFDVAVRDRTLEDDLCGWIEEYDLLDSRRCRIVVNASHAESRRRFTIAHMLGHHYYHRDMFDRRAGQGANADRSYDQKEGSPWWNPAIGTACKRRANTFAMQLLMPKPIMLRLMEEGLDAARIAERLCLSERVARMRMEMLRN